MTVEPTHSRQKWSLKDFDFDLPSSLIAQRPSTQRGGSKLLISPYDRATQIIDFKDIVSLFNGDELLIVNDTQVVPARMLGQKKSGGKVEVFFLSLIEKDRICALTRGKLKAGTEIYFPNATHTNGWLRFEERDVHGQAILSLHGTALDDFWGWLATTGQVPLPPYIQRTPDESDKDRYQTVYATRPGAVAAPTAGLHFTDEILQALDAKGVQRYTVTLHVGPGTFSPVRDEDIDAHVMHSEWFSIPPETRTALESGRPIIAVGTTVVRALESYARDPSLNETDIFIRPGFDFTYVDGLITNFHLPKSTLLMLVSALAGYDHTLAAYEQAVRHQLRFYSYGDSSLFWRPNGRWQPQLTTLQ